MAVNKKEFDIINEQYKALNSIKANQMNDQVENTRESLLRLLQENAIDVSDTKSLEDLSKNIEGIQNKIQLEGENGKKLQFQKEAIDKVIKLLNKVKLTDKLQLPSLQANLFGQTIPLSKFTEIDNSNNNPDEKSLKPNLSVSLSGGDYRIRQTTRSKQTGQNISKNIITDKSGNEVGTLSITDDNDIKFEKTNDYDLTQEIGLDIKLTYKPVSLPIESLLSEKDKPFFGHITHTKKLVIGKDKEKPSPLLPSLPNEQRNSFIPQENNSNKLLPAPSHTDIPKERALIPYRTPQTNEEVKKNTQAELTKLFEIDANFMDKERLIDEEIRNKVRNQAEKNYMNAGGIKKFGMYLGNRLSLSPRSQSSSRKKELNHRKSTNKFIEDNTLLQKRIEGNIGTHVTSKQMKLDKNTINRVSLGDGNDERVNKIAHDYLIGKTNKEQTITELNTLFASDAKFNKGGMTGTDIMSQLDSLDKEDYKLEVYQANLNSLTQENLRIRVKLWGVDKTGGTELESSEYKNSNVNTGGYNAGRRINKRLGLNGTSRLAKPLLAAGLGTAGGFGGLWFALGVTGIGAVLQRAKSQDDAMKEIAKTHEDYLAMGGAELQNTIKRLEQESQQQTGFLSKAGAFFGMGQKARAEKQLLIAKALNGLNATGVMISDKEAITNLQNAHTQNLTPILDTLARIEAGQEFDTHFFTSSSRDTITSQRYQIMQALKEAVARIPGIKKETWEETRAELRKNKAYVDQRILLGQAYTQVEKDITSTRGNLAWTDMRNYVKVTGGSALATGLVTSAYNTLAGRKTVPTGGIDTETTRLGSDFNQYALGKYSEKDVIKDHLGGLSQVTDGQTITITGESGVDAVSAYHDFAEVSTKVKDVQQLIKNSGLHNDTKDALLESLSKPETDKIIAYAAGKLADEGNQNLTVGRRAEGIEEITKYLTDHKMNNLIIKDVIFNPDTFTNVAVQASTSGGQADQMHTMFGAVVDVVNTVDTRSTSWERGSPKPWIVPIPYFANTYAASNSKTEDLPNRSSEKIPNKTGYVYDPSKDQVIKKENPNTTVPTDIKEKEPTPPSQDDRLFTDREYEDEDTNTNTNKRISPPENNIPLLINQRSGNDQTEPQSEPIKNNSDDEKNINTEPKPKEPVNEPVKNEEAKESNNTIKQKAFFRNGQEATLTPEETLLAKTIEGRLRNNFKEILKTGDIIAKDGSKYKIQEQGTSPQMNSIVKNGKYFEVMEDLIKKALADAGFSNAEVSDIIMFGKSQQSFTKSKRGLDGYEVRNKSLAQEQSFIKIDEEHPKLHDVHTNDTEPKVHIIKEGDKLRIYHYITGKNVIAADLRSGAYFGIMAEVKLPVAKEKSKVEVKNEQENKNIESYGKLVDSQSNNVYEGAILNGKMSGKGKVTYSKTNKVKYVFAEDGKISKLFDTEKEIDAFIKNKEKAKSIIDTLTTQQNIEQFSHTIADTLKDKKSGLQFSIVGYGNVVSDSTKGNSAGSGMADAVFDKQTGKLIFGNSGYLYLHNPYHKTIKYRERSDRSTKDAFIIGMPIIDPFGSGHYFNGEREGSKYNIVIDHKGGNTTENDKVLIESLSILREKNPEKFFQVMENLGLQFSPLYHKEVMALKDEASKKPPYFGRG